MAELRQMSLDILAVPNPMLSESWILSNIAQVRFKITILKPERVHQVCLVTRRQPEPVILQGYITIWPAGTLKAPSPATLQAGPTGFILLRAM